METWRSLLAESSQSPQLEHKIGGLRNPQSPSTMNPNYRLNGNILFSAIAILFFVVFISFLLHICAKRLRRRSGYLHGRLHHDSLFSQESPLRGGLDKEIVEALPIFGYNSPCLSNSTKAFEAVECVVCLSVFQQDETCKLLPKCQHFFHIDCIDMWFVSNTTCPLCRTAADPSDGVEVHDVAGSTLCCFTNQDGGNEQYQRAVEPTSGTIDNIARGSSEGDTLLRGHCSLPLPSTSRNYRKSKSEKFSHSTQGGPLPTNVLCWGNSTHTPPRMNPTHWQTGGRSFSHTTLGIWRPQESLVVVSSEPSSHEPCSALSHHVHHPLNKVKSLKRLPSNK